MAAEEFAAQRDEIKCAIGLAPGCRRAGQVTTMTVWPSNRFTSGCTRLSASTMESAETAWSSGSLWPFAGSDVSDRL